MIVITIFAITACAFLAGSLFLAKLTLFPETETYDQTIKREIAAGYYEENYINNLTKEEIRIDSDFGYCLHGYWIENNSSKKTVILAHGFSVNLYSSFRYLEIFLSKGFNVLLYDEAFHGQSGGKFCTMGHYEKYDLRACVSWVEEKCGSDSLIGVHGESMGASTALMCAALEDRISFVISDCAFEDNVKQLTYQLKNRYGLPAFPLLYLSGFFARFITGYAYSDVSPIKVVDQITVPVLFIHGDSDTFTLTSNTRNLFEKKTGRKELYISRNADHAESLLADRVKYRRVVHEFIDTVTS